MASTPVITSPADFSSQALPFDIEGTSDGVLVEARDDAGLLLPATENPVPVIAGEFTIHVTGLQGTRGAQYASIGGLVEAPETGASDDFIGAADTLLAAHNPAWANLSTAYPIIGGGDNGLILDGSGNLRGQGDWCEAGARYTGSTSDTSRAIIGALQSGNRMPWKGVAIRANGTSGGYQAYIFGDVDGTSWTHLVLLRDGSWVAGVDLAPGTYPIASDHTLDIVGTPGASDLVIRIYVDDVEVVVAGQLPYTDPTPLASGNPGIWYHRASNGGDGGFAQSLFRRWSAARD